MATATLPPTLTPTSTPLTGPVISAFGLADTNGTPDTSAQQDAEHRSLFVRQSGFAFIIFIEGRPGPSGLPVGVARFNYKPGDPAEQPDLQIESSNDLGRATAAVCDGAFPVRGGVTAVDPPDFGAIANISATLNDLSCRFKTFLETDFACTQDSRSNYVFASASSTTQFCTLVDDALTFPSKDTVLTARLRDTAGNAGPPAQIVVRVTGGP
jgi:hypothetical protein